MDEITESITITLPENTDAPIVVAPPPSETTVVSTPAVETPALVSDSPQDALNALKKQLEDSEARAKFANEAAARATTERHGFERMARENAVKADQFRSQANSAGYDSVVNALSSAQSQQENLQQQIAEAAEKGEHGLAAKLHAEMAKIGARIVNLEDSKVRIETERASTPEVPQQQNQQQPQETFEQFFTRPWSQTEYDYYISSRQPGTANWLRSNARFATDPAFRQKVGAAYEYVTKVRGIPAETNDCFNAIEEAIGARQPEATPARTDPVSTAAQPVAAVVAQPRQALAPAAPPSRNVPTSGNARPNQITLSPEQRAIARQILAHVTKDGKDPEVVYAQQLAASAAEGKIGTAH